MTPYAHNADLATARERGLDDDTIMMMNAIRAGLIALGDAPDGCDLDTFQEAIGHNVMAMDRYFELKFDTNGTPNSALIQAYHDEVHWHLTQAPVADPIEDEEV